MKRTAFMLVVTMAAGIVIGMVGTQVVKAQQEGLKRTELLKTELSSLEGKEANMVLVEFEPGAVIGRHFHPGDELAYILEGSLSLEREGQPAVTMKAGDAIHQPPKQVHSGRNTSATDPVKLIVIWIVEKGQPLTVPVKTQTAP